jgi:ribulose-5-phosphate 4-epimerase/fuculose-1-phosphate aldolase
VTTSLIHPETRERLRLLAAGMRILHNAGLDSGVAGHLSCRVEGEGAYWINSWGVLWDEFGPDDFVKMSFDLEKVGGWRDLPSLGSGFHAAIYRRRPDVNVICHTHAPYLIALAAKGQVLGMYDQRSPMFLGRMGVFEQRTQSRADGAVFFSVEEAEGMAEALGDDNFSLLLTHHGAVTVGADLPTTVVRHLFLEECARTQVWATVLGAPEMPADVAAAYHRANEESGRRVPSTWEALLRRLHRTDPELFADDLT